MKDLAIIIKDDVPVIDSRIVAEHLEIQHKNLIETIRKYQDTIEFNFGRVTFETIPQKTAGGIQNITICYLTEDQSIFITTLSRNTEVIVNFKAMLVKSFSKLKSLKSIQPTFNLPQTKLEALKMLVEAEEIIIAQNKLIEEAKPKVEFFDTVAETKDCFDLKEVAAMLKIPNGKKFYGRNQIFEKLRENGYLMKNNLPFKSKIDSGLFKVIETSFTKGNQVKAITKTLVTQKGLVHLEKLLNNK